MKVWLVQRSEPTPHDNNGEQRAMRTGTIAELLVRAGHHVVWWTSTFDHYNRRHRHEHDTRLPVAEGYQIQYLRGSGYNKNMSLSRLRDNSLVARRFEVLAGKDPEKPDIILASIPTAELANAAVNYAELHGIPILLDIRDLWPDVFVDVVPGYLRPFVRLASWPIERIVKNACRRADAIIGLTDAFVEWGVSRAGRVRAENDGVFPMGYMSNNISASRVEDGKRFWKQFGIGPNSAEMVVTFIGTIGKTNDLLPVVECARLLQQRDAPVKIIICGAGETGEFVKGKARGIENILMPGWLNAEQIRAILELADIGIAPYIKCSNYVNNFPNKPAEYLSGGLGIALSLKEGPVYDLLIRRHCGFSYDNNARILADELESLARNKDQLRVMQQNAMTAFKESLDAGVVYTRLIRSLEEMAIKGKGTMFAKGGESSHG
jgi:glycosyltransferase involved in cell wall biosynthesis